jgi:hypothetical protein
MDELRAMRNIDPTEKHTLHAGNVSLLFNNGYVQYVTLADVEAIRRVYFAFRDKTFRTVPYSIEKVKASIQEDRFALSYTGMVAEKPILFPFTVDIIGTPDGEITMTLRGEAHSTFLKNRIGFCVLYPEHFAGKKVMYKKCDARERQNATFPELISPHQPFTDICEFSHALDVEFWMKTIYEGDVFEMEDQRNWSDSSYKMYSNPLRDPYPVEVRKGQEVWQRITFRPETETSPPPPVTKERHRINIVSVSVSDRVIGTVPTVGTDITYMESTPINGSALTDLPHFDHLRLEINTDRAEWKKNCEIGFDIAGTFGIPLSLVLLSSHDFIPDDLFDVLRDHDNTIKQIGITRSIPPWDTDSSMVQRLRAGIDTVGPAIPVGGGSAAWFTEINRVPPPIREIDFLFYALSPQVHLYDDDALFENLPGQLPPLRSAHHLAGDTPLQVGPIMLRPRFSPDTGEPIPRYTYERGLDDRLKGPKGTVWTLATLLNHARGKAAGVTFYELAGPAGIFDLQDGMQPNAFSFFMEELIGIGGCFLLETGSSSPLRCAVMSASVNGKARCYTANLTGERIQVSITGSSDFSAEEIMRINYNAGTRSDLWRAEYRKPDTLPLGPYEIIRFDHGLTGELR